MNGPAPQFRPATIAPLPDGTGTLKYIKIASDNPMGLWTEDLYHKDFEFRSLLRFRAFIVTDPEIVKAVLLTHQEMFPKSAIEQLVLERATGKGLSDLEVRDNILTFVGAGHETTSLALTWALYLLSHHPEWQEKLADEWAQVVGTGPLQPEHIADLHLHDQVVSESMRLYPPAPAMDRVALEDITLGDLEIKKGDAIVLAIYPMHRHHRLWDNPDRFDPTRFAPEAVKARHRFQYIPFSAGTRVCIGWKFAMMEAVAILAQVLNKVHVAPVDGFVPTLKSRITLRPSDGMQLQLTPK